MLIISNPVAGDKKGSQFVKEHVIPLLIRHASSVLPIDFKESSAPGEAGLIAARYLKEITTKAIKEDPIIIASGGDTTIKEIVNEITGIKQPASLIIVPSGTANALYHSQFPPKENEGFIQQLPSPLQEAVNSIPGEVRSKLYAVLSFLSDGVTRRLYATRNKVVDANAKEIRETISCVVVSSGQLRVNVLSSTSSLTFYSFACEHSRYRRIVARCLSWR